MEHGLILHQPFAVVCVREEQRIVAVRTVHGSADHEIVEYDTQFQHLGVERRNLFRPQQLRETLVQFVDPMKGPFSTLFFEDIECQQQKFREGEDASLLLEFESVVESVLFGRDLRNGGYRFFAFRIYVRRDLLQAVDNAEDRLFFAKRIEKVPIGFPIIFQRHILLFPNKRPREVRTQIPDLQQELLVGLLLEKLDFQYFVRLEADTGGVHHFEIPVQGLRIPEIRIRKGGIEEHSLVKSAVDEGMTGVVL